MSFAKKNGRHGLSGPTVSVAYGNSLLDGFGAVRNDIT